MRKKWKEMKDKWGALVLGACVVIVFYLVASHLSLVWDSIHAVLRAIQPILVGIGVAYVINPFAKFNDRVIFKKLRSRKLSWILSVILALIILLVIIALILYILIPEMIRSVTSFANNVEGYLRSLNRLIDDMNLPESDLVNSLKEMLSSEGNLISRGVQLLVSNIPMIIERSSSFTTGTVSTGIGFILAIYFLLDKFKVKSWIKKGLSLVTKANHYDNALNIGRRFNSIFAKYITCELIDAAIVGIANYIFMLILDSPYGIMISVVVGVANLVPTFGPIVGAVIGCVILLLADPIKALWFLIFTIVLQTIDGYWIKPKLFGDVLNVPGVVILLSIIIFGRMFGILGIFLSIPLAAILVYILQEFVLPRMERKKAARLTSSGEGVDPSAEDGVE